MRNIATQANGTECNPWDKPANLVFPTNELSNNEIIQEGIRLVALYLEHKGYEIISTDESGSTTIDIIARQDDTIVLCEVKTRIVFESDIFPDLNVPAESLKRYRKAVCSYFLKNPDTGDIRFDVVSLVIAGKTNARLRHLINVCGMETR